MSDTSLFSTEELLKLSIQRYNQIWQQHAEEFISVPAWILLYLPMPHNRVTEMIALQPRVTFFKDNLNTRHFIASNNHQKISCFLTKMDQNIQDT